MGRLTQKDKQGNWSLKGLEWKDLHAGALITQETYEALYGALRKLLDYEETGMAPGEIENINDFGKRSRGMSEKIRIEIEAALKKMYLDVANNYDVSDLHTDSDKVACVASRCRSVAVELIREIFRKHMNDGWIPVEERLPEDGTYLCTLKGELCGIEEPFTGMCGIENGIWDEDDCVIAWQQLPEPYKGV